MKLTPTKRNLKELSDAKRSKRRQELIDQFKKSWLLAGKALEELRDDEHWKDTHTSWIAFCKDNFGISKTKLWEIIKYTEVVGGLSKENQSKITSIDQGLALSKIPEDKRDSAILDAEKNGGISADSLRFHAAKPVSKTNVTDKVTKVRNSEPSSSGTTDTKPPSKPKSPIHKKDKKVFYDVPGIPIPDDALKWWEEAWDDKDEEHKDVPKVQDILTQISNLKSIVVGGREKGELRWLKVTNSIENTFDSLRSLISEAKPYAVCTTCQGVPSLQPEGCNFCKNTGLISRWQWDTQSRQEVKDIVMRRAADLKREREYVH